MQIAGQPRNNIMIVYKMKEIVPKRICLQKGTKEETKHFAASPFPKKVIN